MRRVLPLAFFLSSALLTGCAKDTEPMPAPVYLLDQRWVLTGIEGHAPSQQSGSSATDLFLSSVDSRNSGQAPCNRYGGKYQLTAGTAQLTFGDQFSTYAACADQNQEARYFQLLPQVRRYVISNGELSLYDAEHAQPLLVYKAAE
ncbi:META domain-containing protein [Hymenobacter sublimis]|uniref:META domain-containing protein n=1 Tax=Hymenobacter sublimis TaxID=2933777 RepID=A0ABY4J7T6_9BACT|nr:META domain-containing protein [Hymenobacter sublimis]UPL48675.1 META domain-containing protein [Hymenobacter sublimis]